MTSFELLPRRRRVADEVQARRPHPRLLLFVSAIALVVVPFGFLAVEVATNGPLTSVDMQVEARVNAYNRSDLDAAYFATVMSLLGSVAVLTVLAAVAVIYLGVRRRWRHAGFVTIASVAAAVAGHGLKHVVGRSRPHFDHAVAHAAGYSFPSGHALNSTVVYGALLIVLLPRVGHWTRRLALVLATFVLITAIAASRVVLAVHYPSDVAAGMIVGIAIVVAGMAVFAPWPRGPLTHRASDQTLVVAPTRQWLHQPRLTNPD